jgi:hypothetical protein
MVAPDMHSSISVRLVPVLVVRYGSLDIRVAPVVR